MEANPPKFTRKSRSASGSVPIRRGDESSHFAEIEQLASAEAMKESRAVKADLPSPGEFPVPPVGQMPGAVKLAPVIPVQPTLVTLGLSQESQGPSVGGPSSAPRPAAERFRVERPLFPPAASRSAPPVKAETKIRPTNPVSRGPGGRPLHAAASSKNGNNRDGRPRRGRGRPSGRNNGSTSSQGGRSPSPRLPPGGRHGQAQSPLTPSLGLDVVADVCEAQYRRSAALSEENFRAQLRELQLKQAETLSSFRDEILGLLRQGLNPQGPMSESNDFEVVPAQEPESPPAQPLPAFNSDPHPLPGLPPVNTPSTREILEAAQRDPVAQHLLNQLQLKALEPPAPRPSLPTINRPLPPAVNPPVGSVREPEYLERDFPDDSSEDEAETRAGVFNRPKGRTSRGLNVLRPADPDFRKLMDYRFYRIPRPSNYDRGQQMRKLVKTATHVSAHMHGLKFGGTEPTLVFDFLEQYHKACSYVDFSENEAYLVLDKFLEGRAKSLFSSTVASDRTSSGISGWVSAVNWILRTFATDTNIARAVTALRTVRQNRNENEEDYFSRFVQLHTACGNYLPIDRLKTLFVNGLDSRIIETVRSYLSANPRVDLALLLEEARRQGSQVRELISSLTPTAGRKILTPATRSERGGFIAYERNDSDSENDQAYLLGSSDHTDELPTGSESSYPTIDFTRTPDSPGVPRGIEDLLNVSEVGPPPRPRFNAGFRRSMGVRRSDQVRNVPAPPIPLSEGTAAGPHARPGWQIHPVVSDRVRSMTTAEYGQYRRRIICYLCYAIGHISRSCGLDPIKQAYQVLSNWQNLSADEQKRVGNASMQQAVQRVSEVLPTLYQQLQDTPARPVPTRIQQRDRAPGIGAETAAAAGPSVSYPIPPTRQPGVPDNRANPVQRENPDSTLPLQRKD